MPQKIKKLSSYLFKIRIVFLFVVLVLFCLFLPLYYVKAGWVQNLIIGYATIPFAFFAVILGYVAILFSGFAGVILNWVISPNFITLSYTNPAGNPIIKAGLDITQGFVNMLLVLVLIYIALATILRLAGHETKKLLITFIIVALLVNFAPVICGLVVDASNIVMNFFISELAGLDVFTNNISRISESYVSMFKWDQFSGAERAWGRYFSVIGIGVFNFFLAFVLLLFAALFVFRHIAIWLLVILSPLAFVCYILPRTREYFNKWWQQLFNWSFIGAVAGFFLYLGFRLVLIAPEKILPPKTEFGITFDSLIPYWVALAFLFMGLIFGFQTSAIGASTIINLAKRGGKASSKWVAGKTWKGIAAGTRRWLPSLPKKSEEAKWYQRRLALATPRKAAAWATKKWEKAPFLRWYRPERLRRYGEIRPQLEALEKEVTGPSEVEMERVASGDVKGLEAATRVLSITKNRGDSQDIITTYAKKHGHYDYKKKKVKEEELFKDERFLQDKTLIKALELIKDAGERGKLERVDPRLALIGRSQEEGWKAMLKAVVNAKPAEIAKMEREVPENKQVLETAMALRGEDYFRGVGKLKGGVPARQRTIDAIFSDFVEKYKDKYKLDLKKDKENWGKFMKHLSKKYNVLTPGIAKAITNPRMRSAGWGYEDKKGEIFGAKYLSKEERGKKLEEFAAIEGLETAMGGPPPSPPSPSGRRPGGKGSSGRRPGGGTAPTGRKSP